MASAVGMKSSSFIANKKSMKALSTLVDSITADNRKGALVAVPPTVKKESWTMKKEKMERKKRKRQKANLLLAKKKAKLKAIAKEERKKAKRAAANMWSGRCSKCQKNGKGANYCRNIVCHRGPDWRVERDRLLILNNGGVPTSSKSFQSSTRTGKIKSKQIKSKVSTKAALDPVTISAVASNKLKKTVSLNRSKAAVLSRRRAFPKIPGTPDYVCYLSPTAVSENEENHDDWTY